MVGYNRNDSYNFKINIWIHNLQHGLVILHAQKFKFSRAIIRKVGVFDCEKCKNYLEILC